MSDPNNNFKLDTSITTINNIYITTARYDDSKTAINAKKDNKHLYFDLTDLIQSYNLVNNKFTLNNSIAMAHIYFDFSFPSDPSRTNSLLPNYDANIKKINDQLSSKYKLFKECWSGHIIFHTDGWYNKYGIDNVNITCIKMQIDNNLQRVGGGDNRGFNTSIDLKFDNEMTRGIFTNISYDDLKFNVNDIYSDNTLKESFNNIYSRYKLGVDIYAIPLRMKLIML
jgi:hypothetical protein